jgi:hypothetical protein
MKTSRFLPRSAASLAAALFGVGMAQAAPMGFAGSAMTMADYDESWRMLSANYALTRSDAIGASLSELRPQSAAQHETLTQLEYVRLLKRWNLSDAQANVWLFGGLGQLDRGDAGSHLAWSPGIQADYETTRLYAAATARLYRAGTVERDQYSVRAGFSFYQASYDEPQPWLIVDARRMVGLYDGWEVTPMLRIIHKRFFIEGGVSDRGNLRANLMVTFF